jgi:hypothetical protein
MATWSRRKSVQATNGVSRALAVEIHKGWLEGTRHLNMEHLRERKKEALRQVA